MALNTIEGCSQYFEDTVVPRLREKFPDLVYKQGRKSARIRFERTRRYEGLRKYDGMLVWMSPRFQGNSAEGEDAVTPPAIVSGNLRFVLYDASRQPDPQFQWDDLNVMMDEIGKLGGNVS